MTDGPRKARLSRRALIAGAVTGVGTAAAVATVAAGEPAAPGAGPEPFHGPHQQGIVGHPLPYIALAALDLRSTRRNDLARMLRAWTDLAGPLSARTEARERTTVTFGIGPGLFALSGLGLGSRRPAPLQPLPAFPGEAIDDSLSHGDLCVQVCAGSADTAHHALRAVIDAARPVARLRWRQTGFRPDVPAADPPGLLGFRDGTANLDVADSRLTADQLWVDDGPSWLHGGTYLVVRRIRLLLDTWDRIPLADQEAMVGRHRDSNARLTGAPTSHAQLASPANNAGVTLLRRSYAYDAGADVNGLQDSGLIFLAFQRDPGRQFVPLQRRLAAADGLNAFSQHVATGVFACPGGVRPGSFVAEELVA